ncbi:hypothetical protein ACI2K4_08955 [Micromonospora sp. NPDC050397]|uniref:hypothetical protein n=1 Tax=Micromonospora sp. NPDC050397 TaxID=3364279 RepID=UPI00384A95F7
MDVAADLPEPSAAPAVATTSPVEASGDDLVVASLAERIDALLFLDRSQEQVTELLVDEIADWAAGRGWRVYRRAASVLPLPPPYAHRQSFLDVACARPDGPPLAIEVDRSDRRRSVEKLLAEAGAGRVPVWIRWGTRAIEPPPAPIRLVTCPVTARRGPDPKARLYSRLPVREERAAPEHATATFRADEQTDLFAPGDSTASR